VRVTVIALLTLLLAACASPRQWTEAELSVMVSAGQMTAATPLSDFEFPQRPEIGYGLTQRRVNLVDIPGRGPGHYRAVRQESEEARYQRLMGTLIEHFARGCDVGTAGLRAEVFQRESEKFADPTLATDPRLRDLAIARRSITEIVTAELRLAGWYRTEAQRLWDSQKHGGGRKEEVLRWERDLSNAHLYGSAQVQRNVRILRERIAVIDQKVLELVASMRRDLNTRLDGWVAGKPTLAMAVEYAGPFVELASTIERFTPCGIEGLAPVQAELFQRLRAEFFPHLRKPYLAANSSSDTTFFGNRELDHEFFYGEPLMRDEMNRRHVAVMEGKKEAERRRQQELAALRARRVRENLPPDETSITESWAQVIAQAGSMDSAGSLSLFGNIGYLATWNNGWGYCRALIRSDGNSRCTRVWRLAIEQLKCEKRASAHHCTFVSRITSEEGRVSTHFQGGVFRWKSDGSLSAEPSTDVSYVGWGFMGRGSTGSRAERSSGEVVREMQDTRCDLGLDGKWICSNR